MVKRVGPVASPTVAVLAAVLMAVGGAMGALAAEELRREFVPGMDLWTEQRKAPSYWGSQPTVPELVSRVARHRAFMAAGVPIEYRGRKNPYPAVTQAIDDGGALYARHCAACHGANGLGDGQAGRDLSPSPALLAALIEQPIAIDEYLLWTIADGGAQFGSEMPAFGGTLSEQQIWQIVTYMRAGFPALGVPR